MSSYQYNQIPAHNRQFVQWTPSEGQYSRTPHPPFFWFPATTHLSCKFQSLITLQTCHPINTIKFQRTIASSCNGRRAKANTAAHPTHHSSGSQRRRTYPVNFNHL